MGLNLGVFNTAIYGKIVWCSFKSFEIIEYIVEYLVFRLPKQIIKIGHFNKSVWFKLL